MKLSTVIIITKGTCYFVIGGLAPLSVGLAQWANTGEWPPRIIWIVIIGGCVSGAFSNLLSFLSGAFSEYMQGRPAQPAQPPLTSPPADATVPTSKP